MYRDEFEAKYPSAKFDNDIMLVRGANFKYDFKYSPRRCEIKEDLGWMICIRDEDGQAYVTPELLRQMLKHMEDNP